ncbi:hypothetical protein FKW77_008185 [Venturia effusa]|uniref:galacturonan 1,4-alpha-galacturonidase n=1 Tax=Venturia effusa TaxID=50376 RepID=A0A517L7S1_9PEZI|nr:hypothetical protein FKW77_008185 [Venturia effusa]
MLSKRVLALACLLSSQVLAQTRSKTCNVPPASGTADSTPAILDTFKNCSSDSVVVFKEGADYNIFTPLTFPTLKNVEIRMGGILHFPKDIPTVQKIVAAGGDKIFWIIIKGTNVDWIGSSSPNNGWIEAYGQNWYDTNPVGTGGLPNRPKLLQYKVVKGSLVNFKVRKPIAWCVSLIGSDVTVDGAIIDASSTSGRGAFNTDGFSINGNGFIIKNSKIMNGDDAITVHTGTNDFVFRDSTIGYETHGLSIGSLGMTPSKTESLSNLLFQNITMMGGLYGARIKSWAGGKGLVTNVTWDNIKMTNVTFPAFVTQIYQDQGKPKNSADFTWSGFTGTINSKNPGDASCLSKPCWYEQDLPPLKHNEAPIFLCASAKSCSNFVVKNFNLKNDEGVANTALCKNVDKTSSPNLGVTCTTF